MEWSYAGESEELCEVQEQIEKSRKKISSAYRAIVTESKPELNEKRIKTDTQKEGETRKKTDRKKCV